MLSVIVLVMGRTMADNMTSFSPYLNQPVTHVIGFLPALTENKGRNKYFFGAFKSALKVCVIIYSKL